MSEPISRRDFLKLATVGLGALAFAGGYNFLNNNPQFLRLVGHSLKTGKALDDVGEILKSRFNPETEVLTLGEKLTGYSESWMEKVSTGWDIYHVPEADSHIGFFDVTNTCGVAKVPVVEVKDVLPNRDGELTTDITTYNLDKVLLGKPQLTIPNPQFESYSVNSSNKDGDKLEIKDMYLMYAAFRNNGRIDTSACLRKKPSGRCGGLILGEQGNLLVLTPNEFKTFDFDIDSLQAQIEFAFIIESDTVASDLDVMEAEAGFKSITHIDEYTNCLVSFYDTKGNISTKLVSTLALFDEENNKFGKDAKWLTIIQLAGLINDYSLKNGYARYVIAVPDVASVNNILTPVHYPVSQAREKFLENLSRVGDNPFNTAINGEDYEVYRGIGSGPNILTSVTQSFPYVLTSSNV